MPEAKVELNGIPCVLFCCFFLFISVDIASLVISQQDDAECDGEGSIMSMSAFAVMAGAIGIALSVIGVSLACCFCKISDPMTDTRHVRGQLAWSCFSSVIYAVISIIGFVNYDSGSDDCQSSPLGQVVLAWCIIRIVSACCTTSCATGMYQQNK